MKKLTIAALIALSTSAFAANTKKSVSQVTDAITLTEDVDYTVTSDNPFATTGSINIENTDHAVIIFTKIKPSKVLSSGILKKIYINGQPAVAGDLTSKNATAGSNCQVKMYNRGAIIMPYDQKFRPLTCYTEADFKGESCNDYTEGHSGGFMKSLTSKNLNNQIKSFKLKRGYMVTFALGTSGWGYSRCFIADNEDLEVNLPANMSGRISSYRLFKWWDASKAGIHDTSAGTNNALNTTSCFDWAQGNESLLPDVEWVPNHIYEDWPSASTCGGVIGSCHMKTNNEPGNSADDHPQDVATVLNNWQNLMRTGMRLCSESSHDGSMGHLKEFIEEIDKRGWRCDILDLHCYWTGQFWNLDWYRSEYGKGRPIWISEWVYGSSWGNAGIFKDCPDGRNSYSTKNQQKNYDLVKPVLEILNSKDYIERYFYWNSEAPCSNIYKDGQNSILGKYYASMETGLAYNKKNEYVPKVVYNNPTNLAGTYNKAKGTFALTWNDPNGDMLDSLVIEVKPQGATKYTWAANVPLKDQNGKSTSYTATMTPGAGASYYRIAAYPIGAKAAKYSNEVSVSVSSAMGNDTYQYGKLTVTNTEPIITDFSSPFDTNPAVFMGIISNKNAKLAPGNLITSVSKTKFTYQVLPWTMDNSYLKTVDNAEEIPFLAIKDTSNFDFGGLACEVGNAKVKQDTTTVTFAQPFPEGVKPIILTELRNPTLKTNAISIRVWDVTNTGFKTNIRYEEGTNKSITLQQTLCYLAIQPGVGLLDAENELLIAAGHGDNVYGSTYRTLNYLQPEEPLYFENPLVFGALQTLNYNAPSILRNQSDVTVLESDDPHYKFSTGVRIKRMGDLSSSADYKSKDSGDEVGWLIIANLTPGSSVPTAIKRVLNGSSDSTLNVILNGRQLTVPGSASFQVYSITGAKANANNLTPGAYIIKSGGKSAKVMVK